MDQLAVIALKLKHTSERLFGGMVLAGYVGALALTVSGCATPIGVTRGSTQEIYRALTANALSAGEPSTWSKQVLHRNNLTEQFDADPVATLAELHRRQQAVRLTADRMFALAELSFLYAEHSGNRDYYLAAAAYAYAFLLPDRAEWVISVLDTRFRLAVDLYNWGLSRGLASPDGHEVLLEAGTKPLPFGTMTLAVDPAQLLWGGYRFTHFIPVGDFRVRGLANRYRQPGVGAPLAAEVEPVGADAAAEAARARIPPRIKVPVTALVRFTEPVRGVLENHLEGRLEVYAADQTTTVWIGDREVPLELEQSAALAYMLEGAEVWDFELAGFRFADSEKVFGDGLFMLHPYEPGQIPVILVHGTASSPARWADMYNEIMRDPSMQGRYQIWLFQYNTGQPILYSEMLLRRALTNVLCELDPDGKDPALRRMVVIGHSQGGLLAKLLAVHTGDRFWENVSRTPFDQVEMVPETRALLREGMFFEPFPAVARLIFIATPHRGSYRATGLVVKLVQRITTLPGTLTSQLQGLLKQKEFATLGLGQLPTSVENMSPNNPFLRALNDLPIDPRIPAHSIIAVRGGPPYVGKSDGVVAYESAHIEGVESELVVNSGHSTQSHPDTLLEVRRILQQHIGVQ
jgi:pimeloyl-ACP methyl ester carboxylesterase